MVTVDVWYNTLNHEPLPLCTSHYNQMGITEHFQVQDLSATDWEAVHTAAKTWIADPQKASRWNVTNIEITDEHIAFDGSCESFYYPRTKPVEVSAFQYAAPHEAFVPFCKTGGDDYVELVTAILTLIARLHASHNAYTKPLFTSEAMDDVNCKHLVESGIKLGNSVHGHLPKLDAKQIYEIAVGL